MGRAVVLLTRSFDSIEEKTSKYCEDEIRRSKDIKGVKNKKVPKNAIYYNKIQQAKFWDKPLFGATKQHLNTS